MALRSLQREGAEVTASEERLAQLEEEAREPKRRVESLAKWVCGEMALGTFLEALDLPE